MMMVERLTKILILATLISLIIINMKQNHLIEHIQQDKVRLQYRVIELDKQLQYIQEQQQYILKVSQDISKRAGVQW
jgi:type VI protein secretion system component Hcp